VRLIKPEGTAGFVKGRQLLDILNVDQAAGKLNLVVVMKETVFLGRNIID